MPTGWRDLTPGSRVVVRRRLRDDERDTSAGDGGPHLTDVVGELLAVDDASVTVRTTTEDVVVARADVVTAKVVPPRPVRRGAPHRAVGTADLERVMVEGNPPVERERLGGWLLRAGGGYTGRANSALPLGDPGLPLDEAVSVVERWYDDRGLRRLVSVFGPTGFAVEEDPLGDLLLRRGYRTLVRTLVMTAPSSGMPDPHLPPGCRLLIEDTMTDAWFAAAGERVAARADAARAVLTGPREQSFLSVVEAGTTTAVARVPTNDGWSGVFGVQVRPELRRRGLGRALTLAGASLARSRGDRSLYLQVERSNTAAVALYETLGFSTHHEYLYLGA
jgi:ribosomal protein S18 acetylase RimI-like enzyme